MYYSKRFSLPIKIKNEFKIWVRILDVSRFVVASNYWQNQRWTKLQFATKIAKFYIEWVVKVFVQIFSQKLGEVLKDKNWVTSSCSLLSQVSKVLFNMCFHFTTWEWRKTTRTNYCDNQSGWKSKKLWTIRYKITKTLLMSWSAVAFVKF